MRDEENFEIVRLFLMKESSKLTTNIPYKYFNREQLKKKTPKVLNFLNVFLWMHVMNFLITCFYEKTCDTQKDRSYTLDDFMIKNTCIEMS